jgi:hypothetical protein
MLLAGCGGADHPAEVDPPVVLPPADTRVTDTFFTRIVVYPDGGVGYLDAPPVVRVQKLGPVQVTAVFTSPVDCLYQLCVCQGACTTCALMSPQGPGPNLGVGGTVNPGDYQILLGARSGGISSCRSVPIEGARFSYELVVLHP